MTLEGLVGESLELFRRYGNEAAEGSARSGTGTDPEHERLRTVAREMVAAAGGSSEFEGGAWAGACAAELLACHLEMPEVF